MRTHVLDASALFRYLTAGPGAEQVGDILTTASRAGAGTLMSVVNWGEVYYGLVRRVGLASTQRRMAELLEHVPIALVPVSQEYAEHAARLKVQYNLPYAAAFAAALTTSQHVLITADIEHFSRVPKLRLVKLPRAHNKD